MARRAEHDGGKEESCKASESKGGAPFTGTAAQLREAVQFGTPIRLECASDSRSPPRCWRGLRCSSPSGVCHGGTTTPEAASVLSVLCFTKVGSSPSLRVLDGDRVAVTAHADTPHAQFAKVMPDKRVQWVTDLARATPMAVYRRMCAPTCEPSRAEQVFRPSREVAHFLGARKKRARVVRLGDVVALECSPPNSSFPGVVVLCDNDVCFRARSRDSGCVDDCWVVRAAFASPHAAPSKSRRACGVKHGGPKSNMVRGSAQVKHSMKTCSDERKERGDGDGGAGASSLLEAVMCVGCWFAAVAVLGVHVCRPRTRMLPYRAKWNTLQHIRGWWMWFRPVCRAWRDMADAHMVQLRMRSTFGAVPLALREATLAHTLPRLSQLRSIELRDMDDLVNVRASCSICWLVVCLTPCAGFNSGTCRT